MDAFKEAIFDCVSWSEVFRVGMSGFQFGGGCWKGRGNFGEDMILARGIWWRGEFSVLQFAGLRAG